MARSLGDCDDDLAMLKNLNIGNKVQYISKDGTVKIGHVTRFNEYKGRYGDWREHREYFRYTSVTIKLEDGKSHISVSPRNLIKL